MSGPFDFLPFSSEAQLRAFGDPCITPLPVPERHPTCDGPSLRLVRPRSASVAKWAGLARTMRPNPGLWVGLLYWDDWESASDNHQCFGLGHVWGIVSSTILSLLLLLCRLSRARRTFHHWSCGPVKSLGGPQPQ